MEINTNLSETRYQRVAREQRERQEARAKRAEAEHKAAAARARKARANAKAARSERRYLDAITSDFDMSMNH